jgi:hypothetical protein
LEFQFVVEAEVAIGRHAHEVNLVQAESHKLLVVIVRPLQRVVVVGTVLNEATREDGRGKSYEQEQNHGQELADQHADVLLLILLRVLSILTLLRRPHVSTPRLLAEEHKVEEVLW